MLFLTIVWEMNNMNLWVLYRRQRTDCSHSSMPSIPLGRKKGLLIPTVWEHPSLELYLLLCSMEEYFQEAVRAGRDGLPSSAHMFYNAYHISKAKKALSPVMREYVKTDKCKREMIMSYFGFSPLPLKGELHECCAYHKNAAIVRTVCFPILHL